MEESTSKEKVLKKIRDALIEKTDPPYPIIDLESSVYTPMTESLDVTFAEELVKVSGKFAYFESEDEFITFLQTYILDNDWPVMFCYDETLQKFLKRGGIPFESDPEKLIDMKFGITAVNIYQQLPNPHTISFIRVNGCYSSKDFRTNCYPVSIDVCIIG